jgi:hypothetical protein
MFLHDTGKLWSPHALARLKLFLLLATLRVKGNYVLHFFLGLITPSRGSSLMMFFL